MKTDAGDQNDTLRYEKYLDEQSSLAEIADFMERRQMEAFVNKIKAVHRKRVASANAVRVESKSSTKPEPGKARQLSFLDDK